MNVRILKKRLRLLAIIPARKGSKSVREKNLQVINPKNRLNLIQRAFTSAYRLKIFNEIVITTDYRRGLIPEGCTWIERPKGLSQDDSLMKDVILHVLSKIKTHYDYFFLLQPSSPFRFEKHYADLLNMLHEQHEMANGRLESPRSIVSLGPVPAEHHPNRCYTIANKQAKPLRHTNFENKQDLKTMWVRNGAYYVCNIDEFKNKKRFDLKPCIAYTMSENESVDIDSYDSLTKAKQLISHGEIRDEY